MDERLVISSGSDYDPAEKSDVESEGSVSLEEENFRDIDKGECSRRSGDEEDDEAGEAEGVRRQSGKRKRVDMIEGRRWRQKAAGDGVVNDVHAVANKGEVAVSVRGRCTLDIICVVKKTFEEHHVQAFEGMILKPMLEYKQFAMQMELTIALVMVWVSRRRGFRLTGRVVPMSMFDVALMTGLPATGKIVEFGDKGEPAEVGRLVRQRMVEYMEAKQAKLMRVKGSKKPKVFRNYIKVMRKLCEANRAEEQVGLWL